TSESSSSPHERPTNGFELINRAPARTRAPLPSARLTVDSQHRARGLTAPNSSDDFQRLFPADRDVAFVGYRWMNEVRLSIWLGTRYRSEMKIPDKLDGLTFSDDGRNLLAEDDNRQLYRWDVATGKTRRIPPPAHWPPPLVGEAQAELVFDGKAGKVR